MYISEIASAVKRYRQNRGLSQENMSMDLGLSQSQYSRRETGRIQFTADEIRRISVILDVDIDTLISKSRIKVTEAKAPANYKEKDMGRLITLLVEVLITSEENSEVRLGLIHSLSDKLKSL
tara:strand:+ start:713 stop:1078 length:366 start_codon:yes stop_codon:yes gene_type:complete